MKTHVPKPDETLLPEGERERSVTGKKKEEHETMNMESL